MQNYNEHNCKEYFGKGFKLYGNLEMTKYFNKVPIEAIEYNKLYAKNELNQKRITQWNYLDTNNDGYLDKKEIRHFCRETSRALKKVGENLLIFSSSY